MGVGFGVRVWRSAGVVVLMGMCDFGVCGLSVGEAVGRVSVTRSVDDEMGCGVGGEIGSLGLVYVVFGV